MVLIIVPDYTCSLHFSVSSSTKNVCAQVIESGQAEWMNASNQCLEVTTCCASQLCNIPFYWLAEFSSHGQRVDVLCSSLYNTFIWLNCLLHFRHSCQRDWGRRGCDGLSHGHSGKNFQVNWTEFQLLQRRSAGSYWPWHAWLGLNFVLINWLVLSVECRLQTSAAVLNDMSRNGRAVLCPFTADFPLASLIDGHRTIMP